MKVNMTCIYFVQPREMTYGCAYMCIRFLPAKHAHPQRSPAARVDCMRCERASATRYYTTVPTYLVPVAIHVGS
jgi:hypothetical protein